MNGLHFDCDERVREVLQRNISDDVSSYDQIGTTRCYVGNYNAGRPPECWDDFDVVINCGSHEFKSIKSKSYLFLNISQGKKGQHVFFNSISQLLLFVGPFIKNQKKILIHSKNGKKIKLKS